MELVGRICDNLAKFFEFDSVVQKFDLPKKIQKVETNRQKIFLSELWKSVGEA